MARSFARTAGQILEDRAGNEHNGSNGGSNGEDANAVTVLRDVTLRIMPGEFAALQGTSGSGKSTLLHILGLLDRASRGTYALLGKDVSHLSDDALSTLRSRHIGFVFQSFYLIPYATALDNVLMPGLYTKVSHRQLVQRARELLTMVGLADRMHHKPSQLSGGQQQRVALARALMNRPSLVLADEPTGQLDSRTTREILDLLRTINEQGATVILVTHDPNVAAYARRRLHMEDGRIVRDEQAGTAAAG
ncbi:putative ABC transporter ATP-binding protein [Megalodesulfovibrio gigas DSM 1382 = ATCC 19364]|uniref:Putative ABC transporter ATP-binding protein n=1 Tax=Megalodesulfovibrio gigas (strain ATCC 19364 / DSM 1382 / NCIMB 9332 / VKM B-1759) TaxID=1121448 RepID=T2GF85_MEGG1|nr:putative ABC transporter ATP-binding protein [Megalodesulfovibrio gigas DSM 1382 = ATCC 19364]